MEIVTPDLVGLAFGGMLPAVGLLVVGHYGFREDLSRTQSYTYGVASLLIGFGIWVLLFGQTALAPTALVAMALITAAGGISVKGVYWLDKRYGWKSFPDANPSNEKVYRLEAELAEAHLKLATLQSECEQLKGMPVAVAEWQRQEAVAAASRSLEIMAELTEKMGIVYGNLGSLKGVFMNKTALNASVKQQLATTTVRGQGPGANEKAPEQIQGKG